MLLLRENSFLFFTFTFLLSACEGIPNSSTKPVFTIANFPVFKQDALLYVFGQQDFQDPQEPGYQNIGTATSVLFRVRVLELGIGCKHQTIIPSQLLATRQAGGPTPRTINLNRGNLCQTCLISREGVEIIVAHYMSTRDLTLQEIVTNKVRLFKTENAAQNNTLSEQIDSGRHSSRIRSGLDNIFTYYYNSSDQRSSTDPWSSSQEQTIECTGAVLKECFEITGDIADRARYDER